MTQHFTEKDFRNVTQVRIEGNTFGDRLSNSINFVTDAFSFGIKQGVDSIQQIVDFVSPSDQAGQKTGLDNILDERRMPSIPSDDPVFLADNPQGKTGRPGDRRF